MKLNLNDLLCYAEVAHDISDDAWIKIHDTIIYDVYICVLHCVKTMVDQIILIPICMSIDDYYTELSDEFIVWD